MSPGAAWRPRPPAAAPLPPPATPPAGPPAPSPPTPPTAVARLLSAWPNHTAKVHLLCSRSRYNDAMAQPDMTEKTSPHLPGELPELAPDPLDEPVPPDVRPRAASACGAAVAWLRGCRVVGAEAGRATGGPATASHSTEEELDAGKLQQRLALAIRPAFAPDQSGNDRKCS